VGRSGEDRMLNPGTQEGRDMMARTAAAADARKPKPPTLATASGSVPPRTASDQGSLRGSQSLNDLHAAAAPRPRGKAAAAGAGVPGGRTSFLRETPGQVIAREVDDPESSQTAAERSSSAARAAGATPAGIDALCTPRSPRFARHPAVHVTSLCTPLSPHCARHCHLTVHATVTSLCTPLSPHCARHRHLTVHPPSPHCARHCHLTVHATVTSLCTPLSPHCARHCPYHCHCHCHHAHRRRRCQLGPSIRLPGRGLRGLRAPGPWRPATTRCWPSCTTSFPTLAKW
jgi:hypothetical protein